MYVQAEPLLDKPCQRRAVECGIFGQSGFEHVQDRLGKLVGPLGSWTLRSQARQTRFLKGRLGLVEGWAREAEADAGLAHSLALLADPPQHLVFDLDQIVGVEEEGRRRQMRDREPTGVGG